MIKVVKNCKGRGRLFIKDVVHPPSKALNNSVVLSGHGECSQKECYLIDYRQGRAENSISISGFSYVDLRSDLEP